MDIKQVVLRWTSFLVIFYLIGCQAEKSTNPDNSVYIWSHNDYEQKRPLFEALDLGIQMIEVDIHLIDGELYVTHDHPKNLEDTPLLDDLYLSPLVRHIQQNNGQVLPGEELPFYLVIDVKTDAEPTYQALLSTLEPYTEYFYRKDNGQWLNGPIRLLISGNRPSLNNDEVDRMMFLDGRIPNLGMGYSSELYPLISDNWNNYFSWDGEGEIPNDELGRLREYVNQAHQEGKLIRFWGTSDNESVWQTLIENGVDVINVDEIRGMKEFLNEMYPQS